MGAIERDDLPVAIQTDDAEVRMSEVGEMTVAFFRLKEGADFGPALAGLPDDMCQCPHWGYILKGRIKMTTVSGDELYEAGQAFYWPPGHSPSALEDTEYVDFSPTDEFNHVINHITAAAAA
jgi:hypothetical protein